MIGHIKGMVDGGGSPPLFFSITSLEGEPQFKGGPAAEAVLPEHQRHRRRDRQGAAKALLDSAIAEHFQAAQ